MLDRVSAADGVSAISEHTYLHLLAGGGNQERHALAQEDGQIVGYAFLSAGRNRSRGSSWIRCPWTWDRLGAAGTSCRPVVPGFVCGRTGSCRQRMRWPPGRDYIRSGCCAVTHALQDLPDYPLPEGVQVRSFNPQDAAAWLELNAVAFADLPDQGHGPPDDLAERLKQPWFDPGLSAGLRRRGVWSVFTGRRCTAAVSTPMSGPARSMCWGRATCPGTGLGSALTVAGLEVPARPGAA